MRGYTHLLDNGIEQLAACHQFLHKVVCVVFDVEVDELHQVWVVHLLHDLDLLSQRLQQPG